MESISLLLLEVTDSGKVVIDLSNLAQGATAISDQGSETITVYENNQHVEIWSRRETQDVGPSPRSTTSCWQKRLR